MAKVWVLEHLGTARAPLYCFRGVFCAREASFAVPRAALTPSWVSPGALWVRSRCDFCVLGRPLDDGPVSVLFRVGRHVRSVHACTCFVRVRLVKKGCLFRSSWGSRVRIREARKGREERERHPEWHQRRSTITKGVPKPPVKNRQKAKNRSVENLKVTSPQRGKYQ